MYSNINIYALFIILLCFAPLISADGSKLRPDYYNTTCPALLDTVLWGVGNATQADPTLHDSLIKMYFHDCLVNGCDASLLLDDIKKVQGEKGSYQNKNISLHSYKVIDEIKKDVEASCPQTVSCADIVTLAATASITLALKPPGDHGNGTHGYHDHGHVNGTDGDHDHDHDHRNGRKRKPFGPLLGRLDGLVANRTGADNDLPSSKNSMATLITMFAEKGLDVQDMFVLAGAYKIGPPNNNGTKFSVTNILTPLDWNSNNATAQLVKYYNAHPPAFFRDFWGSMAKISRTDVITTGDLGKGEVRKICRVRNSK